MNLNLYDQTAQATAAIITKRYSTSFSLSSRLFPTDVRQYIYNIYGLVRIADEIVDSYHGNDRLQRLNELEQEVLRSLSSQYSSNLAVHAFQLTARRYDIGPELLQPFFASMRQDCEQIEFDEASYRQYICGSAEVIGLMCLKVFVDNDQYLKLQAGASRLGAAFQKINFLRDMAEDYRLLQRFYFPAGSFQSFDDAAKAVIVADVRADLAIAKSAVAALPPTARSAVATAYDYFSLLLDKLDRAPATTIKQNRLRLPTFTKCKLLVKNSLLH